jgi:hypothetical protein
MIYIFHNKQSKINIITFEASLISNIYASSSYRLNLSAITRSSSYLVATGCKRSSFAVKTTLLSLTLATRIHLLSRSINKG